MTPWMTIEEVRSGIQQEDLVLLYISQNNCSVCTAVRPKVEALLDEYPMIKSASVNASEVLEIASELSILTAPVVILFYEGKELHRQGRFVQIDELHNQVEKYTSLIY